ncbi:Hypothetical predicted protein [Octopus vulgaris]|uniref:Uncharacterized protein n=1 Tax=Octopus vulgaris TaxID=6645 RepID=A0AA36FN67_OCTVU|nr:Hypothetical predicted protein [Octopus vulgaris]
MEILQQRCAPDTNPYSSHVGSVLNNTLDLTDDIHCRIRLASAAFGRLSTQKHQNKSGCLQCCLCLNPAEWLRVLAALPASYQDAQTVSYLSPSTTPWLTLVEQDPSY